MTRLELNLPDDIAGQAARAGLLNSEQIAELIRAKLAAKSAPDLAEIMAKLQVEQDEEPMTPEDIAEDIRQMRAERRAAGYQ